MTRRDENASELLAAAARKTRAQIEQLLAERFPRPDLPTRSRFQRLRRSRNRSRIRELNWFQHQLSRSHRHAHPRHFRRRAHPSRRHEKPGRDRRTSRNPRSPAAVRRAVWWARSAGRSSTTASTR